MKTTVQHLRQAERTLEQRRNAAEREQQRRRDLACAKIPALAKLQAELAQTGQAVAAAIGAGKDAGEYIALLAQQNMAAQAEQTRLLQAHGFAADYLKEHHTCDQCRDTGFVRGLRCGCFTQLLQGLAFDQLNMNTPLEQSRFDRFSLDYYPAVPDAATGVIPRKMMQGIGDYCKQYALHFHPRSESLLFMGATGLGKTHLSLAIAQQVIEAGYTVIYGAAQNLLGRMEREHFAAFGEKTNATEQALLGCDLLILDDLGAEFSTSFTQSCIYNIVNTRLMAGMPIIINTNLTDANLEERYGSRVYSRIIGNYKVLRFFGNDIRQAKK
ncbi:MAG: ATP-binding protein [Oscillospiraceae bacterium]|nr:ATP-binding protein [Oscillospiraceae bacterium]